MAGIGFVLRRLVRADGLSINAAGLAHATLASSGPWLVTCIALVAISWLGHGSAERDVLRQFAVLVMYNFSFSLVGSGAVVLVVTRRLADSLYARDVRGVTAMLLGSLCAVFAAMAPIGIVLYGFLVELTPLERVLAFTGLLLTAGIWLAAAFMSALKDYSGVTASFALGMLLALLASTLLAGRYGLSGLLFGFGLGLALVLFSLIGRVLAEYPGGAAQPFAFLPDMRRYWQLALVGLVYNAAIWVDKWIMWFAPGATALGPALLAHEAYESAMFLAYLSIVPSLALLLVDIETRFFEVYLRFYRAIVEHATLKQIRRNHGAIRRMLRGGFQRIALLQTVICLLGLLLAPTLVEAVGGGVEMVPILRYGLLGALFHMLLIAAMAVLAYFDLRWELLWVTAVFFVLNAGLTLLGASQGSEFHGYGYTLATLFAFALAYYLVASRVERLPYLTFVANNPTLRAGRPDRGQTTR
jgi:polysaccharide biosynthesis protein PelG